MKSNFYQLSRRPDIIFLTETWIQSNTLSSELGLINYDIFRKDRNLADLGVSRGGGVLIACNKTLGARDISTKSPLEQLFIKITLANTKIILGVVYLQPRSPTHMFTEHANCVKSLTNKYNDHQCILIGDYNLRNILWRNDPLYYVETAYAEPLFRENADILRDLYSPLNLIHLSPHPNKQYMLDLLFAPAELLTSVDLQEELLIMFHVSTKSRTKSKPSFVQHFPSVITMM